MSMLRHRFSDEWWGAALNHLPGLFCKSVLSSCDLPTVAVTPRDRVVLLKVPNVWNLRRLGGIKLIKGFEFEQTNKTHACIVVHRMVHHNHLDWNNLLSSFIFCKANGDEKSQELYISTCIQLCVLKHPSREVKKFRHLLS